MAGPATSCHCKGPSFAATSQLSTVCWACSGPCENDAHHRSPETIRWVCSTNYLPHCCSETLLLLRWARLCSSLPQEAKPANKSGCNGGGGQGESKAESCPSTWNVFKIQWLMPVFLHKMPWTFRQPLIYMIIGIVFYLHFCFLNLLVTLPLQTS